MAAKCTTPSTNRYTPAPKAPISRAALLTIASNTGCTSDGEPAITFNISPVAACCSRASFNSNSEAVERFNPVASPPTGPLGGRPLALGRARPVDELALRFVAALFLLPPFFGRRAMSAPEGLEGYLIGSRLYTGRAKRCPEPAGHRRARKR